MGTITKQKNDDSVVYEFNSGKEWIAITLMDNGEAGIVTNLHDELDENLDEDDIAYGNALNGMESLLVALVGEGFDLSGEKGFNAIQTALDGIGNNF